MSVDSIARGIPKPDLGTQVQKPTSTDRTLDDNIMSMDTFFALFAQQLANQDMSNPMDQNAFMDQMVQMATIQAMSSLTDASTTSYAASLVGKEVTIATLEGDDLKEVVGTVTGCGLYGGQHVLFVNGESYYLSQVMAVGKIPEKKPEDGDEEGGEGEGDSKPEEILPPTE